MKSGNDQFRYVFVITYIALFWIFVLLERRLTNVAVNRIVKLFLFIAK